MAEIPASNAVTPPDFTDTVNQEFFVEPHGGPKNPKSYLDSFPEALYTHDLNSNLAALLYALLGPAGIGALRKNHLLARLEVEAMGLSTVNLDELYANPFSFARLAEESYDFIPQGLLTTEQWERIQSADAAYRNRAMDYLKAVRAGGTPKGIELAARSGLNRPVEVVENYKALYDRYSDHPLGLTYYGATESTEEVIILPRQNIPTSAVQTITRPVAGEFTIQVPIGSPENSITSLIPFNATFDVVQAALENLSVIGKNNVRVKTDAKTITIEFTGDLADQPIPEVITSPQVFVEVNQAGVGADEESSTISSRDWFFANKAVGEIKPVTAILTPGSAFGITKRQVVANEHADSTFTEVLRYVTGINSVNWPPRSPNHWIEAGVENEAPIPQYGQTHHYVNFHNIKVVTAYTESALQDLSYETSKWPEVAPKYTSEHTGTFSQYERVLMPFLSEYTDPTFTFAATNSLANPPALLTVQAISGENETTNLVENIYPTDYQGLPGVARIPTTSNFWASVESVGGADFLEIDLGSVQAVNYLAFQASNKPYDISVAYDVLDMFPARQFIPVTIINQKIVASTTSLGYDFEAVNPWKTCSVYFTNSLNKMIFTRFIRIKFTRRTGFPYVGQNQTPLPYSIQVKSLRLGRNIV